MSSLDHTDIYVLFTRNQDLRWLLIDEIGMIGDVLLGTFEKHITDAAKVCRYLRRADKSHRSVGGYNLLTFSDLFQIPPIPASSSLCIPPKAGNTSVEQAALTLFWVDGASDSINFFRELTQQKRVLDDPWYSALLDECRFGRLSDEAYILLGLPTEHAGSWPFSNERITKPSSVHICRTFGRNSKWTARRGQRCVVWHAQVAKVSAIGAIGSSCPRIRV